MQILERTPRTLTCLLQDLPLEWTQANEGPETWSAIDVLGHLIHGDETDWIARARIILEHGETRAFAPFDRLAQFTRFRGWTLEALLERFADVRATNLATLEGWSLTREQLARRGRHPDFGTVTLSQLLATWVVHDLGHIAQITRVMAKQYGDAAGPWKAYLPVLSRR
jgi:uncharacterized damage-inducible protein DinB